MTLNDEQRGHLQDFIDTEAWPIVAALCEESMRHSRDMALNARDLREVGVQRGRVDALADLMGRVRSEAARYKGDGNA